MGESKLDLLQGTLDLMVLQTLAAMGDLHGYGIARRIEQASGDEVLLNQGTIYASLVRLQQSGWIHAEWGTSDNNRKAKFYSITRSGRKQLAKDAAYWQRLSDVMVTRARHVCGGKHLMGDILRIFLPHTLFLSKASSRRRPRSRDRLPYRAGDGREPRARLTPLEARRQALIRFGGIDLAKDQQREARGIMKLDILLQDLRYTFRTLRRDRGFTLVAVLILALGIGANIAVFSVVNTILLRPLPFPHPEQLVRIHQKDPKGGESSMTYSTDAMLAFQQQNWSFRQVTGYFAFSTPDNVKLTGNGQPQPATGMSVAGNFFSDTRRRAGSRTRLYHRRDAEEQPSRCAAQLSILEASIWAPIPPSSGRPSVSTARRLPWSAFCRKHFDFGSVFGSRRLASIFIALQFFQTWKTGVTPWLSSAASSPASPSARRRLRQTPFSPGCSSTANTPSLGAYYDEGLLALKDYVTGKLRQSLIVLWCAVGMILLIVCVNLSNLLLARAAARSKEFAMRTALGASRGRIVRQLLTESLMLSLSGALVGLCMAWAIVSWLAHQASIALPLLGSLRIDTAALAWTLLIAVVASLLFGLAPGIKLATGDLQAVLKDSGPGTGEGRNHRRTRSVLVVSEIALACVLLVGAGLLLRSFLHVLDVDLGFEPSHSAAISVSYNDGGDPVKRGVILQQILLRANQIPGVETAGISDELPMSTNRSWGIAPRGGTTKSKDSYPHICLRRHARLSARHRHASRGWPRFHLGRYKQGCAQSSSTRRLLATFGRARTQ